MLAYKFNLVNGLLASLRCSSVTLVVKCVGFGEDTVGAEFVFTSKLAISDSGGALFMLKC